MLRLMLLKRGKRRGEERVGEGGEEREGREGEIDVDMSHK